MTRARGEYAIRYPCDDAVPEILRRQGHASLYGSLNTPLEQSRPRYDEALAGLTELSYDDIVEGEIAFIGSPNKVMTRSAR